MASYSDSYLLRLSHVQWQTADNVSKGIIDNIEHTFN